jgi:TusA-related sulfurtransferase
MDDIQVIATIDTRGKTCPEPMAMMKAQLDTMKPGEVMGVWGDVLNKRSMERFVKMRRHELVSSTEEGTVFQMLVRKSANERTDIPLSSCVLK